MFATCLKERPNRKRAIIWITMIMMISNILVYSKFIKSICIVYIILDNYNLCFTDGSGSVFFLFLREKLGWTIENYTNFVAYDIAVIFLGVLFGAFILVPLGISGPFLIALGNISATAGYIIILLATKTWHMYLSTVVGVLKTIASPMMRALLSNTVESNDIGKIISLTTTFEALSSVIAAPLYSLVYNMTLDTFPGAFNIISMSVFASCIFGIM